MGDTEFLQLPLGEHSSRKSSTTTVEKGVVRSLVRTFDIEKCAAKLLPQLGRKKKKNEKENTETPS